MDQHWHSIFNNSLCQPWLYFCYRFEVSFVKSLTLSIPYVNCHSVFIDNFKFYRDFVLADDLWINTDIVFLTIPYVSHDSNFSYRFDTSIVNSLTLSITYVGCHLVFIDHFKVYSHSFFGSDLRISLDIAFLTIPWDTMTLFLLLIWCIGREFINVVDSKTSAVIQYSLTISSSIGTLFLLTIYGSALTWRFWQFHAWAMTLFLLLIWCISREFIDAVNYIHRLSVFIEDFKVYSLF
jgi:hypothetical protein